MTLLIERGYKKTNRKYNSLLRLLCVISMLVMILIGITVYGASLGGTAICVLFFFFYVLIPGMMVLKALGLRQARISTFLMTAGFMGWALCVFLTYLASYTKIGEVLILLQGPIMSAAYLKSMLSGNNRESLYAACKKLFLKTPASYYLFVTLAALFCLLGTQYRYLTPPNGDFAFISGDRAYHMGLANSVSHGLPLESLWIKGIQIKYHIFTDILFSVPIRLFGVGTDVVGQMLAPILTVFFVGISMYAFFREMSGKPNRAGVYCLIFFCSGMFITRRLTSSMALKFIFTNDNYAGFGLAALLIFIVTFKKWYEAFRRKDRSHVGLFIICLILAVLITGIKGPVAAVLIAGLWGTVLLGVALRKVSPKAVIPVIILTLGFMIIYVCVLGANGQVNTAGGAGIKLGTIIDIAFWKNTLVNAMKNYGIPKVIRMLIVIAVFTVMFFTVFTIPFVTGYIREVILVITGKKEFDFPRVFVYASALVGFIALMLLDYTGHNQVYFGLVTIILAPIISFWFVEDLEIKAKDSIKTTMILRSISMIMMLTLVLSSMSLMGYYIRRGAEAAGYANQTIVLSKYGAVSRDEYNAMLWIKKNTDKNDLLASDRYYSVPPDEYNPDNRWHSSFFLYELYANRFSYISGSAYDLDQEGSSIRKERIENNRKLYDPSNSKRGELAKRLGIDYVIVSKRFSGELKLESNEYRLCFTNRDVDIYQIV